MTQVSPGVTDAGHPQPQCGQVWPGRDHAPVSVQPPAMLRALDSVARTTFDRAPRRPRDGAASRGSGAGPADTRRYLASRATSADSQTTGNVAFSRTR